MASLLLYSALLNAIIHQHAFFPCWKGEGSRLCGAILPDLCRTEHMAVSAEPSLGKDGKVILVSMATEQGSQKQS